MTPYTISQIARIVRGELRKISGGKISYLLIDSRKVLFARESLFFAIKGVRNNGHRYLKELYDQGVRNFIIQEYPENIDQYPRANFVLVSDTLKALQDLASFHRKQYNIPIIGITGSNGKTIVKEWIYQCLGNQLHVVRNPKSYNSQLGVPLSVWLLDETAQLGVFEAGISMPNEMQYLEQIIQPDIGILTNLGDAHQEHFETKEQKLQEKMKLFRHCKVILCKADDHFLMQHLKAKLQPDQRIFSWGKDAAADLLITQTQVSQNGTYIEASWQEQEFKVNIPFIDKASIENALQVWSLMLLLKMPPKKIKQALASLESVAMRLELREGTNNCTIINDSYNSDLESLHIALDFLAYQNQHPAKTLILSDIAQSGYNAEQLYTKVAQMIVQKQIDRLIGIGPQISAHQHLFDVRKEMFKTTTEFLDNFTLSKLHNTTILLKGARSFAFEDISRLLRKQTNRTELEIDLTAVEENIKYFKGLLKPTTGIIAMVKAFSYGSGTHEIANICQFQRVSALAVAFADEGVDLRNHGIRIPILVMNPEEDSFAQMIEANLEPQLNNMQSLASFDKVAGLMGQNAYPVHLKLDTGMHRSGFTPEEMDLLLEKIGQLEYLQIKTTFSHLSSADEAAQDEYTHWQAQQFEAMTEAIDKISPHKIKRHILNSAGAERFPEYQYDYVRIGIGMYGISANQASLSQAATLKSTIAQIKIVKAGATVGYNRKGVLAKDTAVAIIPMGYADGLRRSLGNGRGKFLVQGQQAPIIGNVCMDLCMIDVSDMNVKVGDSVELFGKHQSILEVAKWMDTIPYEVLTGISRRVKRTYLVE